MFSLIDNIVHGFVYNFFTLASGIVTALIVGGFIIYYKFTNRESNPWFTWKKIADYRKAQFNYSMASNKYEHIYLPLFYLYESLRFELDRANRYKSTDNQYYEQLKNQALLLEEYANAIAEQKQKLYENSPIPPDYRTFDCVVMLNYIFRNNLADTMSQAVLLYEDRVFKGEVIRGVQKMYEMLGNLSHSMKAIEYHFLEIRREINTMTSEVCKISEHLYESSELQKDMLNESRATKYAIESVQRSNELLLLHQNQQRGTYYQ